MKWSLLVERTGSPLGIVIAGANVHDTKLLDATLDAVVVRRPSPVDYPQHLCLEATTTQRARPQCATTNTSVTLASVPDSLLMRQTGSGIRRGVGLSSAPSRGCRSSEAFWSDTRCMTRTTSGYCNSRALSSGRASGTLSKHRPLIEIDSKTISITGLNQPMVFS